MAIETISSPEAPRPQARVDYDELASAYNLQQVGGTLRIGKVTNVTNFKKALHRRGLSPGDYEAYQRGRHCFLKRLSEKTMTL